MVEMILGIGNTLKGDDGIGIYVAEKIGEYLSKNKGGSGGGKSSEGNKKITAISCGTVPENYTSVIRKCNPDRLVLVDAADMGLSPGSCRIIPLERIEIMQFSTHNIPLPVFITYVRGLCGEVVLIGIQPDRMDLGSDLSNLVRRSGDKLVNLIIEERLNEIQPLSACLK